MLTTAPAAAAAAAAQPPVHPVSPSRVCGADLRPPGQAVVSAQPGRQAEEQLPEGPSQEGLKQDPEAQTGQWSWELGAATKPRKLSLQLPGPHWASRCQGASEETARPLPPTGVSCRVAISQLPVPAGGSLSDSAPVSRCLEWLWCRVWTGLLSRSEAPLQKSSASLVATGAPRLRSWSQY